MKNKLFTLGLMSVLVGCVTPPVPAPVPTSKTPLSNVPPLRAVPDELQSMLPKAVEETSEKHVKAKREYDIILLALLDSSKQKGDPDYLANAHKMAYRFVMPTFKQNEQKIILEHAVMRHNQANYNGFYYPDFPQWLRVEVNASKQISTQKQTVPMNGGQNER